MVTLPGHRIGVGTGNNVQLSDELRRRTVWIRLDPGVEAPERRTGFRHDPLIPYVIEHRADLVWACLVILRAWLEAGRPSGRRVLGRFEDWSRVMGGVLDVAGVQGFLENIDEMRTSLDPQTTARLAFVEIWWNEYQSQETTGSELWSLISDQEDIVAGLGLGSATERGLRTQFGQQLVKMRDRIVNGRRVVACGHLHGARRWKLTPT
jgi:hypothetical protein